MAGKLIVFEGIDGSGKTTQVKLFPADKKLSFPRYDKFVGKLIKLVLTNKWVSRLNPYPVAFLYALDRYLAKPAISQWLKSGHTVVLDRYTYSSLAHQGAKFKGEKQKKLVAWIDWLENRFFKLPQADMVIYLLVPPKISQQILAGRRKDLADADLAYQQATAKLYLELAKRYKFTVINCVDSKKRLLSKDDVAQKITAAIN
jgi:dTMP kinase